MRRRIGLTVAATIAGLLFYIGVWPFIIGPERMKSFCASLVVGSSLAATQRLAEGRGYRWIHSTTEQGRPALIVDARAMGRFICQARFEDGRLVDAKYVFND